MNHSLVKFLIVDDDEVCTMKIKRAISKAKLTNPVYVARDGVEALEVLRGDGGGEQVSPPYVVTLDINMPRMNGHEFLREIRSDPKLKNVVIFILTTSDNCSDIAAAYDRNVAGYILKERSEDDLLAKVMLLENFSNCVVFPST